MRPRSRSAKGSSPRRARPDAERLGSSREPAVAAGHPATTAAGARDPRGGRDRLPTPRSRACLASCVAETVMTGLPRRRARDLLGRGLRRRAQPRLLLRRAERERRAARSSWTCRSARSSSTTRSGAASCAVPGVPAGLDALWREYGRLPWARALRAGAAARARGRADAAGARRLPRDARAGDDDARGRADLRARGPTARVRASGSSSRGSSARSSWSPTEGAASVYRGSIAESLLELVSERDGVVTRDDLAAYEAMWAEPVEVSYAGTRFLTRGGLAGVAPALERLPRLCAASTRPRARSALLDALDDERGPTAHTTNLVTVDARGQRLRPDHEPRARLRRLAPRPRPAPEQHARRGRPARRRRSSRERGCRA